MARYCTLFGYIVAGLLAAAGGAQAQDTIKIGGIMSLTGGGATSGLSYKTGMEMAATEINKAGGIAGRKLELVFTDDQTDSTAAVGEAKRLVFQEKISVFVGPLISGPAIAAAPVFVEGRSVSISASGSSKINPQDTPNTFSMFLDVETQTPAIVDYISKVMKAKHAAVLMDNGQQAREMAEIFRRLFPASSTELVAMQEYQIGQPDVTAQLLSLRKANPDLLFVSGVSGADFARIMKARDDLGWTVPVAGGGSLSFLYREVANTLATSGGVKLLDGVAAQAFKALLYCPGDPVGASPYAQFLKRLEAFNPEAMKKVAPINAASAYDAVFLYKAAIEGLGGKTDGTAITRWIEDNGSAVTAVTIGRYSPSRTKHFMFGPEVLSMGEKFDQPRADGLFKQAGC